MLDKALAKRKGRGFDISIIIGHGKDDKGSDMAPDVKDLTHQNGDLLSAGADTPMHDQKKSAMMMDDDEGTESMKEKLLENPDMKNDMSHEDLLAGMSDYDKDRLMKEDQKGLGGKARKAALMMSMKKA